jgi:glycosyltransferase involved in cell wall biosynthesis
MKITQIMLAKGFGGAERLFVDLCLSLAEEGQEVHAICAKDSKSSQILSQHAQIELDTISIMGSWDPFAPLKVSQLMRKQKTELVQAHLARGALIAGKACKIASLPLVVTTHNYIDVKYYKNVTMLVPPTKDQYNYYLSKGISENRMTIINHFSPITPVEKKCISERPVLRIVSLGRLVKKKGFGVLVNAFSELQSLTNNECELIIGGAGPEENSLLTQIENLRLNNKVELKGWIDDVSDFLKDADIFVLPSLDEPFGIVVLEAMALGLPIITTDTPGPLEMLDKKSAWFCKTGDASSLANALQLACDDLDERSRKSINALAKFKQSFSKQAVIPEFLALFDSLLSAAKKPSLH